jgi:4-hydroxythreonine-4-phosphate dehydrogenase
MVKKLAERFKINIKEEEIIDLDNIKKPIKMGAASAEGGRVSAGYIQRAVEMVLNGDADAIVTAPINKEALKKAGVPFPGHTEMLAALTGAKEYAMLLAGSYLRVVLVTIHTAIKNVPGLVKKESVYRIIRLTDEWLRVRCGIKNPKIAVAALNPHGGENGLFGKEEIEEIIPGITKARKALRSEIIGPVVPDILFFLAKKEKYDAIVCMYHDQGLIPLKMEAFEKGVNITLGLPIVRTSPDHGTAYNIAGKGIANTSSFIEAIRSAVFLISRKKWKKEKGKPKKTVLKLRKAVISG